MKKCTVNYELLLDYINDLVEAVSSQHIDACTMGLSSPEYLSSQKLAHQRMDSLVEYLARNITDWGDE